MTAAALDSWPGMRRCINSLSLQLKQLYSSGNGDVGWTIPVKGVLIRAVAASVLFEMWV